LPTVNQSSASTVRCPLCRESFAFAEVLERLPPALEVVEPEIQIVDDGSGLEADGSIERWQFPSIGPADERASASASPDWSPPDSSRGYLSPRGPALPSDLPPRVPRRRITPLALLLQWVLGGFVGVAGALLLCWWLLDRDPGFGPQVARFVPWVVPEKFRGPSVRESSRADERVGRPANRPFQIERRSKPAGGFDGKTPAISSTAPTDSDSGPTRNEPKASPSATSETDPATGRKDANDETSTVDGDEPSREELGTASERSATASTTTDPDATRPNEPDESPATEPPVTSEGDATEPR
jgi:hypothetical protein